LVACSEIAGGNAREFGNLFGCRLAGIRGTEIFRYCPHFANGKKLTEEDGTNGTDGTNVRYLPGFWLRQAQPSNFGELSRTGGEGESNWIKVNQTVQMIIKFSGYQILRLGIRGFGGVWGDFRDF